MNIVLGVTGGIAAYKSCELCSLAQKEEHSVQVIQTKNAIKFVGSLSFEGLTGKSVLLDTFDNAMDHIHVAKWADILVLAPLSANVMAKITHGICDDLLTTIVCATPRTTPILLCPAMNTEMWFNPITQRNLQILEETTRFHFLSPVEKRLACGDYGVGGLASPADILKECLRLCPKH